jgi:hypothetical protein
MVLTKAGWDECKRRIIASNPATPGTDNVSADEIATSRQLILAGPAAAAEIDFYERDIEIKVRADEAWA